MIATASVTSGLTTECANPLIAVVHTAFDMLLDCQPQRTGLTFKNRRTPEYEVSAVIGLTGKAVGTIVPSLTRQTALHVLHRMIGVSKRRRSTTTCEMPSPS